MPQQTGPTHELRERLGPEQVVTDPTLLYQASMDNMRHSRIPAARIFPADEDAVATVLELANAHRVPVTGRGSGSATTGSATPGEGGWVLDLSRWKHLHIDPVAKIACAQPGVTLAELDAAAETHGLMYPPDPGSREYATLGGSIATNAGGMRGAKYGVTRDYVLSLEGFMPTGEFVRWGSRVRKFSAGYNIRDLWIGSEGTLGIITGAVLRLLPRPETRATCLALFPGAREAITCAQALIRGPLTPSALEFLDSQTVACTLAFWRKKQPGLIEKLPSCLRQAAMMEPSPAALLIEVDGEAARIQSQVDSLVGTIREYTANWATALDTEAVGMLWKLRKSCSQAMFELGSRKINEDVVVPLEHHLELLEFLEALHRTSGLPTPTFGHAADGNFHAHIMYDEANQVHREAARSAVGALMRKVVELEGAISGEHGIGLAKSTFLHLQHSPQELAVMRSVKACFDPNGILNPDKLWSPVEPWDLSRESVRMPWDH